MPGKVQTEAGQDQDDTDRVQAEFQGTGPAGRLQRGKRSPGRRPGQQEHGDDDRDEKNRDQELMLSLVDESQDGTSEGCAKSDEGADVDRVRREQTADKCPHGHPADPGDLCRVDAQAGDESSRKDGTPTASL